MHLHHHTLISAACGALALCAALAAQAQTTPPSSDANLPAATARHQAAEIARGDPDRWFREDITARDKLRTAHKEIAAALQEALGACKRVPAAERAACIKEARSIHQQEMAGARERVLAER